MLQVAADVIIFVAFLAISLVLAVAVWSSGVSRQISMSSSKIALVSVAVLFILLLAMCGLTHLFIALRETDQLSDADAVAATKVVTAILSVAVAAVLCWFTPTIREEVKVVETLRKGRLQEMSRLMRLVTGHCTEVIATHSVDQFLWFLSANGASQACFGKHPDHLLGQSFYSVICDEDVQQVRNVLENVMFRASQTTMTDLTATRIEYRAKMCEDGEPKWMESSVSIAYENMQPLLIIITRDITSRRLVELQRFQETEAERDAAVVNAKLHFLACAAHDLKTPLATFRMAIDELQQTELSHAQKTYLTQAFVCMDLMTLTIAQALDVGRATAGKQLVPRRVTVQLPELLQHCHIVIQGYSRRVPIHSHVHEEVCPAIITDKEWLWQMIMNYLTNACKYTDKGSINVSLELADSKTMLMCKVADTGIGVRPEMREHLFNPYSEIQRSQNEGTGVGLWSVKLHCEGLGGSCGMFPNPDAESGSVFWFKIPYTPDYTAAANADGTTSSKGVQLALEVTERMAPSVTLPSLSVFQSPARGSALVVDDAPLILSLMRKQLNDLGFTEVHTCNNGKEALEIMMQRPFDIVFCDSFMPLMTGPEATRRFREWEASSGRPGRQMIVAMSANSEQEDVRESQEAGFDHFLPKPITKEQLRDCIQQLDIPRPLDLT